MLWLPFNQYRSIHYLKGNLSLKLRLPLVYKDYRTPCFAIASSHLSSFTFWFWSCMKTLSGRESKRYGGLHRYGQVAVFLCDTPIWIHSKNVGEKNGQLGIGVFWGIKYSFEVLRYHLRQGWMTSANKMCCKEYFSVSWALRQPACNPSTCQRARSLLGLAG